jgi:NAD(P)-dependent dehydrogenase (short-subunit alcohol dehydrogenase family)
MQRLAAKVALITGGASGIGRACAELFARDGAHVVLTDIHDGGPVADQINGGGGSAHFETHDVTDEEDWIRIVALMRSTRGRLDILVNNAGIVIAGPIWEMSLADWRRQQAVNLDGVFLGIKHALPLMRASGGGSIINVASTAALKAAGELVAYSATKGGVRALSRSVALQCARLKDGVRVNSIYPGVIGTPIYDTLEGMAQTDPHREGGKPLGRDPDALAALAVPLGVKGRPEDIANAALYLACEDSRYVTGAELVVDGGLSIA